MQRPWEEIQHAPQPFADDRRCNQRAGRVITPRPALVFLARIPARIGLDLAPRIPPKSLDMWYTNGIQYGYTERK